MYLQSDPFMGMIYGNDWGSRAVLIVGGRNKRVFAKENLLLQASKMLPAVCRVKPSFRVVFQIFL
jgi:hypothetical protein